MKAVTFTIALIIYSSVHLLAQDNRPGNPIGGIIVKGGKNPGGMLSFAANGGSSSSSGVSGAAGFNPNVGLSLFWGGFGIGADAGIFTSKMDNNFYEYGAALKGRDVFSMNNTRNKWTSLYLLAGPQYTFGRRALSLTISVKGGITHRTAPEFAIRDNISGTNVFAYTPPADDAKNVFTVKPGVSIACRIASRWAVVANVQYLLQPAAPEATISYRDLSQVDFTGNGKELSAQLSNQPYAASYTKGPDKYLSAGIGFSYTFRPGQASSRRLSRKVTTPGATDLQVSPVADSAVAARDTRTYTGGRKNDNEPAAKSISSKGVSSTKPGKNEAIATGDTRTYTGGRKNDNEPAAKSISSKGVSSTKPGKNEAIATGDTRTYTGGRKNDNEPAAKSISSKGVSRSSKEDAEFLNTLFINNGNDKVLDPKLFKLVTSDSEIKGMKVSFKKDHKVYKYLGDQERIVEILQSANRPAACTDCTTRECNGKVYDCACVNGFCYCIICIDITKLSELAE
jgi:hypothetical protein